MLPDQALEEDGEVVRRQKRDVAAAKALADAAAGETAALEGRLAQERAALQRQQAAWEYVPALVSECFHQQRRTEAVLSACVGK